MLGRPNISSVAGSIRPRNLPFRKIPPVVVLTLGSTSCGGPLGRDSSTEEPAKKLDFSEKQNRKPLTDVQTTAILSSIHHGQCRGPLPARGVAVTLIIKEKLGYGTLTFPGRPSDRHPRLVRGR